MSALPACPSCLAREVEVLHESKPGAATTHATLKCEVCGHVFKDILEAPTQLEVHAVISEGGQSRSTQLELPKDERVRVGDELFGEGHRLLVTGLEHDDSRRVRAAPVPDIKTVWCKVFDSVTVKVSVNKGWKTHSDEMEVVPEEEFYVGDEIEVHNQPVRIKAIKTDEGIRHHGSAQAKEIVRMFAERTDWRREQQEREREEHRRRSRPKRYREDGGGEGA